MSLRTNPPIITAKDKQEIVARLGDVLELLGFNDYRDDPSMKDTPERVMQALLEYRQPLDPSKIFKTFDIEPGFHEIVVQNNIPFSMLCEHHLLPAMGTASLGYVPNNKVLGLSKMVRLVRAVGFERPSLQERRLANT